MGNSYIMHDHSGRGMFLYRICFFIVVFLICSSLTHAAKIVELNIKGPIGPATADYVVRNLDKAQHADMILILLDTPGGLYESTRAIIQKILASNIPIVTYVSPNGARAANAGTYIAYASSLAAMAPGSHLGAASPRHVDAGFSRGTTVENQPTTMDKKITNDALATIRSLAQLRGHDPFFAQKAVLNAATLTATEALKEGVINYIATDDKDLLSQMNGVVVTQNNHKVTLDTSNPEIKMINPDWRIHFLSLITDPTIAYLLLLLGIYGIFFELVNPGFVLPGVVGAVSMLVALYALQLLPINYAGFWLIILGIGLIIGEAFIPAFGSLGVGGTVAFILGSIMLVKSQYEVFHIAWSVICGMAAVNIFIFVVLLGSVVRTRRQSVKNGIAILIGAQGRALGDINKEGQAIIRGEIWSVRARHFIAADKSIKVIGASGLVLEIEEEIR